MGATIPPAFYAKGSLHALATSGAAANTVPRINAANSAWEWRASPGLDVDNVYTGKQTHSGETVVTAGQRVRLPTSTSPFVTAGTYEGWSGSAGSGLAEVLEFVLNGNAVKPTVLIKCEGYFEYSPTERYTEVNAIVYP